ncbi:MAG: tetratricopeptide repeat protein [Spirochaetaceae bacterium]|jgi:tetratricopeptide (TPR) repeat protein|nr:tetratricopeptide repeat protein [Spirochaetaceae bacterium]
MRFSILRYSAFFILLAGVFPAVGVRAQLWQQGMNEGNAAAYAQINRGIELYGDGQWGNAIIQLRRAQQENIGYTARAEAQFWIAMAAFAAGDYEEAIHDFDEIGRIDPSNIRCVEVPYHKGRAYYYLKRYDEAIKLFSAYIESLRVDGRYINGVRVGNWNDGGLYSNPDGDYNRKSSAIYWMGECFYSLGDMTRAEELLNIVIKEYPKSHKFEPAINRLALIKQKKVEGALLDILKSAPSATTGQTTGQPETGAWTETEQRKTTEEAILEYQRRITPYLINEAYREQNGIPVAAPENQPPYVSQVPRQNVQEQRSSGITDEKNRDAIIRLLAIKTTALEIMDRLVSALNTYEIVEDRW